MLIINKLFGMLSYGYSSAAEPGWNKRHSNIVPTASSISLRNSLFASVPYHMVLKATFLLCYLARETSSWDMIQKLDPNNTYVYNDVDLSELKGLCNLLNVDSTFKLLPIAVRNSAYSASWLDKVGLILAQILKGNDHE